MTVQGIGHTMGMVCYVLALVTWLVEPTGPQTAHLMSHRRCSNSSTPSSCPAGLWSNHATDYALVGEGSEAAYAHKEMISSRD